MKLVLVYNPHSGGALSPRELRVRCNRAGIEVKKFVAVEDAATVLRPYLTKNTTIAVIGGDGTISHVAGLLAGTNAVLAPLPGGTLNHFTKDLGISQDVDEALEGLAGSTVHPIDYGEVNGTVFINNSSIGLYPSSLRERNAFEKRFGKWPAAVAGCVRALVRLRTYDVTIDNETLRTPFIFVGNNDYQLSEAGLPERKRLNDGELSVFIARTASRWSLAAATLFMLVGKVKALNDFEIRRVRTVTIKTKRGHVHISRDGELVRETSPLTYKVRPGKLNVRY